MKEYLVDLDKPRALSFDFGAWELIAEHFSKKWGTKPEEFDPLKLNISTLDLPFLIWAGLSWEDPKPELEDVKRLLNAGIREGKYSIMDLTMTITQAIFAHAGMKLEAEEESSKKKAGPRRVVPGSRNAGGKRPT